MATRFSVFREATMRRNTFDDTPRSGLGPANKSQNFNYKPRILRTLSLLSLFVITIALIALLQYAVIKLPHGTSGNRDQPGQPFIPRRDLTQVYARDNHTTSAITTSSSASFYLLNSDTAVTATTAQSTSVQTATTQTLSTSTSASPSLSDTSITAVASAAQSDYVTATTATVTTDISSVSFSLFSDTATYSETANTLFILSKSDYVNTGTTQTVTIGSSADQGDYVPTDTTQTVSQPTEAIAYSANPTDYVPTQETQTVAQPTEYSTAPTAYVPTQQTQTVSPTVVESAAQTDYVPPATTQTVSYTTVPVAHVITLPVSAAAQTQETSWTQVVSVVTLAPVNTPSLSYTTVPSATQIWVSSGTGSVKVSSWTQVVSVVTFSPKNTPSVSYTTVPSVTQIWVSSGTGSVQVSSWTQVVSAVTPSVSQQLSYTTIPSYTVIKVPVSGAEASVVTSWTQAVVAVTPGVRTYVTGGSTTLLKTNGATVTSVIGGSTITSSGTAVPTEGLASLSDKQGGKTATIVLSWTAAQVFMGTYLAVTVAVLYRMIWTVVNNNFSLIEPFRQLNEGNGALAERSLFSFYHSQSNLLGPLPPLSKGRVALTLVSTAYFAACFLPALSSVAIYVDTDWGCPVPIAGKNPCQARMTANVGVIRGLQGILAFSALVILLTISVLLFTKTGLPADPSSMATIASLMRNPALLDDLNDMPADASGKLMRKAMAGRRYRLEGYKTSTGGYAYGIVPAYGNTQDEQEHAHGYTNVAGATTHSSSHRFRILDFVLTIVSLGALGVIIAYYFDGKQDGFNKFFTSNSFGPRFILTGAATVVASLWKSLEQSAVIMAPYSRLAHHPSPAKNTLLFTPHNTPILSTISALWNGYFFVALVTFTTLAAEGLNIVISGIPYATGQTWMQFLVSTYMSMAILGLMVIVSVVVILSRSREPKMPRKPDTVAAVMSYLCGSKVLHDFDGVDGQDAKERDRRIRLLGKRYTFEERIREDRKHAFTVDELHGPYE